MYDDDTRSREEQRRVERKLGQLESDASALFRRMLKAFNENHRGLWLTRDEKNLIRKFLFVMKYRGPTFYEKYHHYTLDKYTAEDKDELSTYMHEKGFSRPIDVWLDNIEKIIDLHMDEKLEWISDLPTRMYSHDTFWAVLHCQMMYMAICTPSDPDGEFILTDNCFQVSEGRQNTSTNPQTGELEVMSYLNLHDFAPVSPKLMIVLRSFLLSSEMEDMGSAAAKAQREKWRSMIEPSFGNIRETLLAELPVAKARNNYTLLTNGELRMLPDEDGTLKAEHSFFFQFFPTSVAHTNRMNGIFLEHADSSTSIVFRSKDTFRRTLEWYLTDREVFRKCVTSSPEDSRRVCLLKLERLLGFLGSSAKLHMEELPHPVLKPDEIASVKLAELRQTLPSLLQEMPDDNPTEFMSIYQGLGGTKSSLIEDLDQAARMIRLRIKIDVWSQGISEDLRHANRVRLLDIYRQLPRRRLWLYLKRWRAMELGQSRGVDAEAFVDGPEDIVAKASRLMKHDALNNMMYIAVANDILKRRPPGFEPWAAITLDENGLEQFGKLQDFAFSRSITKCGIDSKRFDYKETHYI
ncbi:hypothetical protein NLG97_g3636 [Lecanicillium saksenae]|uniref:Uncharacterized protein n=1 Tax=Lecanicillium saksenae TaxID=468837 RepID=A0ACC1QYS2_9HYPO|nr:hypothetical protein NLG97_g3636 [Lecanicillium saksenae]